MKPSDDLFVLIKSLTKNEKGYFKKYSSIYSGKKNNNYILLFNAINKQKEYDEKAIKKQFATKKFIAQLNATKNYLYNFIVRSLASTNSGTKAVLGEMKAQVEVLLKKGLNEQCEKIIDRAKEIARKEEYFLELAELLILETRVIGKMGNYKKQKQILDTGYKNIHDALDLIKTEMHYDEALRGIYYLQGNERYIRSKQTLQKFNHYIKTPLLSDEKKAPSFYAKTSFYFAHALYNLSLGNLKRSYNYRKKALVQWQEHPERIKQDPMRYASILFNLIIINTELKQFDEALKYLELLSSVQTRSVREEKLIFTLIYVCRLEIYYKTEQYEKAFPLFDTVHKGIIQYDLQIVDKQVLNIYVYATFICFYSKQYSKALEWLNEILNAPQKEIFDQEYGFARIANLMIHYELGNEHLLESAMKSTYRFLYKREILYTSEKLILDFIRKSFRFNSRKELRVNAIELKKEILKLYKDTRERRVVELLRLDRWIDNNFV